MKHRKKLIAAIVATAAVLGGVSVALTTANAGVTASTVQPTWDPKGHHRLTLDDEFNGTALNSKLWTKGWGTSGGTSPSVNSSESECYSSSQVSVSGGALHLSLVPLARSQKTGACAGKAFKSGIVTTDPSVLGPKNGFQQTYGAFEFRAKPPVDSSGHCSDWPALWLDGQSWPTDGEIDVMECLGGHVSTHLHSGPSGHAASGPGWDAPGSRFVGGWHTYGASWTPTSATFYYDGVKVWSGRYTVAHPNYLIMNLAADPQIGGRTVAPATMDVDWVHVFKS